MKAKSLQIAAMALAVGVAGGAAAQDVHPYYRQQMDDYDRQQAQYRDARDAYQDRRDAYEAERAEYDRQREAYERARDTYDRRYGYGAYSRAYGAYPGYDDWYVRYYGRPYEPAPTNWSGPDRYRDNPCERRQATNTTAGGVIGALAGAAIGSNVAANGARTEGAVLGGLVGAALGAGIGRSTADCDSDGYYFSYDQTYPYQESAWERRRSSGRYNYAYYRDRGCRLAVAPAYTRGRYDDRYVRVCPDRGGRYRITG